MCDKSTELAHQYAKVQWLEQCNTSLVARLDEANTLVSDLGAQDHAREEQLAQAIEECDAQRSAAEQKAQEVKLHRATAKQRAQEAQQQIAALRGNVEDLTARVAQLEVTRQAQTTSLTEKEALIEG